MEQIIPSKYLKKKANEIWKIIRSNLKQQKNHSTSSKKYPESSIMYPLACLAAEASLTPHNKQWKALLLSSSSNHPSKNSSDIGAVLSHNYPPNLLQFCN